MARSPKRAETAPGGEKDVCVVENNWNLFAEGSWLKVGFGCTKESKGGVAAARRAAPATRAAPSAINFLWTTLGRLRAVTRRGSQSSALRGDRGFVVARVRDFVGSWPGEFVSS